MFIFPVSLSRPPLCQSLSSAIWCVQLHLIRGPDKLIGSLLGGQSSTQWVVGLALGWLRRKTSTVPSSLPDLSETLWSPSTLIFQESIGDEPNILDLSYFLVTIQNISLFCPIFPCLDIPSRQPIQVIKSLLQCSHLDKDITSHSPRKQEKYL